ncbi:hypothetical protein DSECCO2_497260 [anaerobic digester metagenome]
MGQIEDALVVGVAMDGGHEAIHDAEFILQHFGHGSKAIRSAGSIGNDGVLCLQGVVINAHHDGGIHFILGRSGENNLLSSGLKVLGSLFFGSKNPRGFDHKFHAQVFPRQHFRIFFGEDSDLFASNHQVSIFAGDIPREDLMHAVVFEQIGQGGSIG